jgi:hypothetical protein
MKIKNLHREGNQWFFRNANDSKGVYYTDKSGEGIFFQSDRNGNTKQYVGTCQFRACETASGMRRKLAREFIREHDENI